MGFLKKNLPVAVLCGCMVMLSIGYSSDARSASLSSGSITDRSGETIALPAAVKRIIVTCYGGASHEIALLGAADKIVAEPSVERFPQYLKMYPRLKGLPDLGSFNDINLEEITALKPDIVFASITSARGNQRMKELGIPVVTVGTGRTDVEGLLKEFKMMGQALGAEKQAADLIGYWKEKLALIQTGIDTSRGFKKKKVFYSSSGPPFKTEGQLGWGHYFIGAAGGINVAGDITAGSEISTEQLLVWDPDAIISSRNLGGWLSPEGIQKEPALKSIRAVGESAVYQCPIGAFWWDRPSPEAILGILWLAKTLYPEALGNIDLKKETLYFFSRFYRYDLTPEEYEAFFHPDDKSAHSVSEGRK